MSVDTTPRSYRKGERPRVIIRGWEGQEVYLTRINSKTAYFRGPYYVGEMAVEVDKVIRIVEPRKLTPYDTGAVLEPHPHIAETVAAINERAREIPAEKFGRVDFDNESSETVAVVYIVRNDDPYATAPYTIRITGNPDDFNIEWED